MVAVRGHVLMTTRRGLSLARSAGEGAYDPRPRPAGGLVRAEARHDGAALLRLAELLDLGLTFPPHGRPRAHHPNSRESRNSQERPYRASSSRPSLVGFGLRRLPGPSQWSLHSAQPASMRSEEHTSELQS